MKKLRETLLPITGVNKEYDVLELNAGEINCLETYRKIKVETPQKHKWSCHRQSFQDSVGQ